MTPADAARLLAVAAVYDKRTVGEIEARAWADALDGLDARQCADAIRRHYSTTTTYLMPAHVRDGVRLLARERKNADRSARVFAQIEQAKANTSRPVQRAGYEAATAALQAKLRQLPPEGENEPEPAA